MTARTRIAWVLAAACIASLAVSTTAGPSTASTPQRSSAAAASVDDARAAYDEARERVAALSAQSSRLTAMADDAEAEADRLGDQVSDGDDGLLGAVGDLLGSGPSDLDRAAEAAADAELARHLADMASAALDEQIAATERARIAWQRAERRQARVEASWGARQAAQAAIRRSQLRPSYDVTDPAQDRRNRRALRTWHEYLRDLARNAVVPPTVAHLQDPSRLRAPLRPLRDTHNEPAPGVALVDPPGRRSVTVLSAEAIAAVSDALSRVGLPEVPGAIDPTTYACGGLVANSWAASPTTADLPSDAVGQWDRLPKVPTASALPGDIVILGAKHTGLGTVGVYVGRSQAVLVDPATGVAAVRPLPDQVLGVRRVGVGAGRHAAPPAGGVCGTEETTSTTTTTTPSADTGGPLRLPVAPGAYHLTAGFGDAGGRWSSGAHTGLDFAAPTGTPVVAAAAGTVTIEHPAWAGNLVRIYSGGGVETWYAHLSRVDVTTGQQVDAGDPVGLVGALGNTTGPHLHFEVRLDGDPYDPAQVLDLPDVTRPTYPNGEVPDEALCPATTDGLQLLRCDAAVAFRLLGAAYADDLGSELCITDSYRSRSGQERVFAEKPTLAATPGTSVHGLGLAVDLCGGVERFDSTENDWLLDHGPAYGWTHPSWAAAGGSKPEPWHFEYVGAEA